MGRVKTIIHVRLLFTPELKTLHFFITDTDECIL